MFTLVSKFEVLGIEVKCVRWNPFLFKNTHES